MWRLWLIKRLGGYPDIQSAIAAIRKEKDKDRILAAATARLFNTVSVYDILRQENGKWFFGDKVLTNEQYVILQEQARSFQKTLLFRVLDIDLKYQTNKRMRAALTMQDLQIAKVIEYVFDIIRTRLSQF